MRNKYDSSVIFLYSLGKENLLPSDFRKKIPPTTIRNWRRSDFSQYVGHEFRTYFEQAFDNLELKYRYRRSSGLLYALSRAWAEVGPYVEPVFRKAGKDKQLQYSVIKAVQILQSKIGMDRALKIFRLSRTRYHQWLLETRFKCGDSFLAICSKHHPHQLALKEVRKMKRLLTDPELDHWPIVSIASSAMRNKDLIVSLYSWYKYARLLGIKKWAHKKKKRRRGLVSSMPNEYLHVDTTYYPVVSSDQELAGEVQVCITFVVDNYSRMILGYHVQKGLSFMGVKEAFAKALKVIETHPHMRDTVLVADGGKENHHNKINEFIAGITGRRVTKITALKDILFSNSPAEAIHKIMKSRYLRRQKFGSMESLIRFLEWAVNDYNTLRPHCAHRHLTPREVYFRIALDFDIRTRMRESMRRRVKHNLNVKCMTCSTFRSKRSCSDECQVL